MVCLKFSMCIYINVVYLHISARIYNMLPCVFTYIAVYLYHCVFAQFNACARDTPGGACYRTSDHAQYLLRMRS